MAAQKPSTYTGHELIAKSLRALNVPAVFGVVGVPVVPTGTAIQNEDIEFISFRNEQVASRPRMVFTSASGIVIRCVRRWISHRASGCMPEVNVSTSLEDYVIFLSPVSLAPGLSTPWLALVRLLFPAEFLCKEFPGAHADHHSTTCFLFCCSMVVFFAAVNAWANCWPMLLLSGGAPLHEVRSACVGSSRHALFLLHSSLLVVDAVQTEFGRSHIIKA